MPSEDLRPSPRHKPVSLFVTCILDMIYPQTGVSVVKILEHLGIDINFPMNQTCCGQPAFNSGFRDDAKQVAIQFLKAFKDAQVIVCPSGSCASMVRHYYPELFKDDPVWGDKALRASEITWEFTEYLVDGLGVTDLGLSMPPTKVAFHHACHGYRLLGLSEQAQSLAANIEGVTVTELPGADQCCGFGGLFAVKMPKISGAMLNDKVRNINAADADTIVTGDASCLTQMNGGLSRADSPRRVLHIADLLAQGLEQDTPENGN
ncbi:MAG: (Fe-S)-binding protein [Anaerolineae bacterium]|nr:(Fe-S)-binding protein [Anaerolineae bacterium]